MADFVMRDNVNHAVLVAAERRGLRLRDTITLWRACCDLDHGVSRDEALATLQKDRRVKALNIDWAKLLPIILKILALFGIGL